MHPAHFVHDACVLRHRADGGRPFVRPAGSGAVWGLARRDAVCFALHDDLSAWYPACHADNRPQPVRQRPGLCDHRHDERCDRRGGKPCSGPDFYLCAGYGRRRGGGRDGALPGSFGGVRAVLSVYQSGVPSPPPAAARAGGQLCLPARYPKLGHGRFHHAADQQRRHDLLQ